MPYSHIFDAIADSVESIVAQMKFTFLLYETEKGKGWC